MDNNDKSTALVSVSDLSVVLQGVKRYIDSSKPNVSWDELANGKVKCSELETIASGDNDMLDHYSLVKIPFVPEEGREYTLSDIRVVKNGEELLLGDLTITLGENCVEGIPTTSDGVHYVWLYEVGENLPFFFYTKGDDCFYFSPLGSFQMDVQGEEASFTISKSSLCPQDYVASSMGNESLKEDIKALSEKETTWDDLYGGEKHLTHNEVFDISDPTLGNIKLMGLRLYSNPKEGDVVSVKNVCFTGDIEYDYEGEHFTYSPSDYMRPKDYEFTLVSSDGLLMALSEDNNNFVVQGNDGNLYLVHGLVLEVFGQQSAQFPNIYDNMVLPYECDYIATSQCPPSYVASSIGNESLEEDIKFLKENSGKVTIDGLVKQEFGEVVSTEYYGMTMQGILTNIPAQEGVSFKLSNIHYEDDIHFYDTSLSEGTPEAVYAKDDANRVMHYPTELSGVLEYHQGALGYSEEFDSTGLHALVDFGLGYMVYVDNFGFELSLKPFISYPLKLEVSSLISPDYIDSSLGKANLREDIESLHLGKTTKWVDTKIAKVGSDPYAGIPWKDEYQYPKAIRYILDGVEIDSENLPEGNTLTIEPSDSFGITWMQIEVNGEPQFLYGDGSLAGVAGLLVLCASDDFVLEKLELKVETCNTISSEFVANMPYIGYNTISSGIAEVESNVTGLPYEKGLKLDATTFFGAISVNGEVFDITMTSGDGTLFGNIEILSGSYKEGDVPYVGMIGLDDDGKVLVIVGSMKPISSVELLQKEWRRKLPKEAIEGDDNEATDTFVAYNYLYLGNARVEGNKLYIDNAEVVDNKIILN